MKVLIIVLVVVVVRVLLGLTASARVVEQYEEGVLFRIVTRPIQSGPPGTGTPQAG